ncbi:hypothetical protein [Parenemella sanctibonifatiensis]|uniref:hypothetical protein n=1 Tax=Parenemella sanctibonifatiensis TaxID=2016505 RepID=UPI001185DEA4|nr:hypothetical protein [Parenemella sanctibonifatiensis]
MRSLISILGGVAMLFVLLGLTAPPAHAAQAPISATQALNQWHYYSTIRNCTYSSCTAEGRLNGISPGVGGGLSLQLYDGSWVKGELSIPEVNAGNWYWFTKNGSIALPSGAFKVTARITGAGPSSATWNATLEYNNPAPPGSRSTPSSTATGKS